MAGVDDNFYMILGLDPSVDDWPTIEARITEKKREWSRHSTTGNPRTQLLAKKYLAMVQEMTEVLKEPERRREVAKLAKRALEEKQSSAVKELNDLIKVLMQSSPDFISIEKVRLHFRDSIAALSEQEVVSRIRAAGVAVEENAPPKTQRVARSMISEQEADEISRHLDLLKLENLYAVLDDGVQVKLGRNASIARLHERAEELYQQVLRVGKTDADTNARKALLAKCVLWFKTNQGKEKYDNWLAIEKMQGLDGQIALFAEDGVLTAEEVASIVKSARERGVDAELAKEYVEDFAGRRNWRMLASQKTSQVELPLCGDCLVLARSADDKKCWKCGQSFWIECPHCKKQVPTEYPACTACGFKVGDWPIIRTLFDVGKRHVVSGNLLDAAESFDKCLLYWPGWKPALEAKQQLDAQRKGREQSLQNIENLIRQRTMMEAHVMLEQFVRTEGTAGVENIRRRIEEGISQAERLFQNGETLRRTGKHEEAYEEYEKSLTFCSDLDKARNALALTPPPSPANLQVTLLAKGLGLRWQPVHTKGSISYRVIRKADGSPRDANDGALVGAVLGSRMDDVDVETGTAWYYAVFTVRSGVFSASAASNGPNLVTAEVANLDVLSGNQEAFVKWQTPKGSLRVEVWRKSDNPPVRPGDGQQVAVSGSSAHDTKLANGKSYGYLIVTVYPDPITRGKEIVTAGIRATAFPAAPPAAVSDLRCTREGQTVALHWTPVSGAMVQIRQTREWPNFPVGAVLSIQQAESLGNPVPTLSAGNTQATMTEMGQYYFVPLSIASCTAVMGKPAGVATVNDVTDLKAHVNGRIVSLTWTWPTGIEEAMVCYSPDAFPKEPTDKSAARVTITRKEYDRAGMVQIMGLTTQPYYFTVFARVPNAEAYSAGKQVYEGMGHAATVHYQVVSKKPWFGERKVWLELLSGDVKSLPPIEVRAMKHKVPLSPKDGILIVEAENVGFTGRKGAIPIPENYWGTGMFVKLFFREPADATRVRLMPANEQRLKLG
jgi:tetratricopeptide (TPR) repeat protein